nr:NlpC/P60 family protein [Planomonospora venezuelensis]
MRPEEPPGGARTPHPAPRPGAEGAAGPAQPPAGPGAGPRPDPGPARPGSGPRPGRRDAEERTRPGRPSPGRIAVAAALRHLGTPYVWGGGSSTGPTRGGFDCSGLALHAWSKAGAVLTHYTGDQFRQGRRVPFSRLRAGDLVFFGGGTGAPTHVGLYVKDGVMVHAPKTGDVVKTTDFAASSYYRARYRGAVRPSPR